MDTQHTPGPWATDAYGQQWGGPRRLLLATISEGPGLGFTAVQNARLRDAAPDMLEMLERMAGHDIADWQNGEEAKALLGSFIHAAQAAVAKARGEG